MHYTINTADQLKSILTGFRKAQDLTQKAMAEKLGISQQTYQSLEANPQRVTVDRLLRVLSLLEVKLILADHTPQNSASDSPSKLTIENKLNLEKVTLKERDSNTNKTTKKEMW